MSNENGNPEIKAENETNSKKLRLKIQPQPDKFPFFNHSMDLTVYLVDDSDHLKCGIVLPLRVELLFAEKLIPVDVPHLLLIDKQTKPIINGNGMCKLNIRISECSMKHGNRKFMLAVSPNHPDFEDIDTVYTNEMMVIRHRLKIQENLPELWYKDEGGRDKCLVLPVHLMNECNELVVDREVPLKVTLLYENEHPVMKQDILKPSPESQRIITNGQANLKLRIEDVSKNHQGQAFRIKVEPDTQESPIYFDVSYDLSTTISVRSKRNKRRPPRQPSPTTQDHLSIMYSSPPASMDNRNMMKMDEEKLKAVKQQVANSSVKDCMHGLIHWTGCVVHGLQALEWQIVGFEMKEDKTPDQSRPIYRCPSCWRYKDVLTLNTPHAQECVIARILGMYSGTTETQLRNLLAFVDNYGMKMAGNMSMQVQQQQMQGNPMSGQPMQKRQRPLSAGSSPVGQQSSTSLQFSPSSHHPSQQQQSTQSGFGMPSPATSPVGNMMGSGPMSEGTNDPSISTSAASAPPPLQRGISDMVRSMVDQQPNLVRGVGGMNEFSNFGDLNTDDNMGMSLFSEQTSMNDAVERMVFYVVAKTFNTRGNSFGLPAFSEERRLLGFYKQIQSGNATDVMFTPLQALPSFAPQDENQAITLLMNEMKMNSDSIFTLAKSNNNIVRLREDAILHHWTRSGITSMEELW